MYFYLLLLTHFEKYFFSIFHSLNQAFEGMQVDLQSIKKCNCTWLWDLSFKQMICESVIGMWMCGYFTHFFLV